MDVIVYDNGSFYVFQYEWFSKLTNSKQIAYGIRRSDRPQDGMIFSHSDFDFCKRIADNYKETLK